MRAAIFAFVCILSISCSNKYQSVENSKQDYQIIPKPVFLEPLNGRFLVDANTKVTGTSELKNEGEYLAELLSVAANVTVPFVNDTEGNIVLKLDEAIENNEGYQVSVSYNQIEISGKTAQGVFYGIQTLRQLIPASIEDNKNEIAELTIPAVTIKDSPRFVYRGMHLDVGRHFFPVDFIKKYIDLIAMHKMNSFHWHLTEDQGWRMEIKKYPKLTEIGSQRKETMVDKNFDPYKGDGEPYGGFYTQKEVKDIVSYATERHVTVIPEIELPGHSLAALAAYPEFGNTDEAYEVGTKWGVFHQIYAPKEETFQFLEDVLTEVMDLFPSKYIHIGGDEAPKKEWEESKFAQEVIKREGLKDEHELQSYFIQRIEKFLNSKGRNIIGWDEILEGGLAPNATVMSWRGTEGGIEAAKQGHNVVMTPGSHCYFDFYQVPQELHSKEPLAICCYTSVEKVYSYNPTPSELSLDQQKYILGAQGNVWTEYMKDSKQVEYMVLPRMTALAEVVWSSEESKNWDDFKERLVNLKDRYDVMGLNYAKHVFEVEQDSLK